MLWIDKYIPKYLSDFTIHQDINSWLKNIVAQGEIPHLIFYGPDGSGKKTRIMALLREIFGPSIDKLRADSIEVPEANISIPVIQSAHHMQLSCPQLGNKDRYAVQYILKDLSSFVPAKSFFTSQPGFRVFILQDADCLSEVAQAGLRRTLEKYVKNARLIMHVQEISNLMLPLRSRALCIRLGLPSIPEIRSILREICIAENISTIQANDSFLDNISELSNQNLRRAILMLETASIGGIPSNKDNQLMLPWEIQIDHLVKRIYTEQTPKAIGECRDAVYDLLACCIPGITILESLSEKVRTSEKLKKFPMVRLGIAVAAAKFAHTMARGSKEIIHIEAFIAQAMALIKHAGIM